MLIRKILFDNIEYHYGGFQDFIDFVLTEFINKRADKIIITHINLRNYYYLQKDKALKEEIKNHCITVFEGIGMKIGFMLKGFGILPDLNGTDLIPLLISKIYKTNYRIFLLGGDGNIAEIAAGKIKNQFPDINLCGYHRGYFSADEESDVVRKINNCGADILLIGMGFPLQEKFALKYKNDLCTSLFWNVGGLFDTLSENKKRAPDLLRKIRLEWLYRFLSEPRRMLHRNTVAAFWSLGNIIFIKRNKPL